MSTITPTTTSSGRGRLVISPINLNVHLVWLVVTGTCFWFSIQLGMECHHPNWLYSIIFQRGRAAEPPTRWTIIYHGKIHHLPWKWVNPLFRLGHGFQHFFPVIQLRPHPGFQGLRDWMVALTVTAGCTEFLMTGLGCWVSHPQKGTPQLGMQLIHMGDLPSGKLSHNYGKSPFLIFNG